jgi:hypothetical protein
MVGFVEAGRLDQVGLLDGVDEVGDGERGGDELGGVGDDVEFGDLAALDSTTVETPSRRLRGGLSS